MSIRIKIINASINAIDTRLSEISVIIDGKSPIAELYEFYKKGQAEMQRLKAEHRTNMHSEIIEYVSEMAEKETVILQRLEQYKNFKSLHEEQMELTFERKELKDELRNIEFYKNKK